MDRILMYEITPPPCPGDFITVAQLYRVLVSTHDWCLEEAEALKVTNHYEAYGDLRSPSKLPTLLQFSSISVVDMYHIWSLLQLYRRHYDDIIRQFEEDWVCVPAVGQRADKLADIVFVLDNSGTNAEMRAAQVLERQEASRIASKQLSNRMRTLAAGAQKALREAAGKDKEWWDEGFDTLQGEEDAEENAEEEHTQDDLE